MQLSRAGSSNSFDVAVRTSEVEMTQLLPSQLLQLASAPLKSTNGNIFTTVVLASTAVGAVAVAGLLYSWSRAAQSEGSKHKQKAAEVPEGYIVV